MAWLRKDSAAQKAAIQEGRDWNHDQDVAELDLNWGRVELNAAGQSSNCTPLVRGDGLSEPGDR